MLKLLCFKCYNHICKGGVLKCKGMQIPQHFWRKGSVRAELWVGDRDLWLITELWCHLVNSRRIPHEFGCVITTHAIFKVDLPVERWIFTLASWGLAWSWEDSQTRVTRWEKVPCDLEVRWLSYYIICNLFCIYGKTVILRSGIWSARGVKVKRGIFF